MPTGTDIEAGQILQAGPSPWGSTQPGTHIVGIRTDRYTLLVLLPDNTDLPRNGTTVWISRSLTAARVVIGMQTLRVSIAHLGIKPPGLLSGWWAGLQRLSYLTLARLARECGMRDTALGLSLKASRSLCIELPAIVPTAPGNCSSPSLNTGPGLDTDVAYIEQQLKKMRQGLRYAHHVHSLAAPAANRKTPSPGGSGAGLSNRPPGHGHSSSSACNSSEPCDRP